jgi:predicted DCC family thiol-disulfide oxidoreductase YuxK
MPADASKTIPPPGTLLVFYDGHCHFCDGTVRFLIDRDHAGQFRFATQQAPGARAFLQAQRMTPHIDATLIVYDGLEFHTGSAAMIVIGQRLPGIWRAIAWLRILPQAWRDAAYRWFARNRKRLFGARTACRTPTADERSRYLWVD